MPDQCYTAPPVAYSAHRRAGSARRFARERGR